MYDINTPKDDYYINFDGRYTNDELEDNREKKLEILMKELNDLLKN